MWFEQVWSGAITIGFVAAACHIIYPMNVLDTGHKHRRNLETVERQHMTARDHRMFGNFYKQVGLGDMFSNIKPEDS
ncbi:hypothetical protein WR25_11024 [Diploscapter pachys]|uniref:Uncharacterized protein n=1 Tax=Diploscapter pachys TaxID=2018661 RepID=A0A2A2K2Z5_9BILA|nr:hypothetical protein WR25_11024 [Diploscapter pachys]